jgi:hypothetical protein
MALGVVIIVILGAIPVIGGFVQLVVTILGLGGLLSAVTPMGRPPLPVGERPVA